jgi:hypothetical protein
VAAGDLDGGGGHPASDVQYLADPVICAWRSSACVDARPPGWITRLPTTAMNL